ncbi:hypothetical protein ACPOL_2080 [Acidisarcina polymorpha]|uniref:HEAT repeat domain-containing protein n=1 Tax=Acidisarcina polymorpha TaxID=2211140 RepID=A0A2Z5FXA8_9BACT|nr:HEAT repeat domain-containing protein [Acidisarcina polymorpha]AXC11412.1 hypothetical protein ACPOL_2080 [Acidisarcina polymorpha]
MTVRRIASIGFLILLTTTALAETATEKAWSILNDASSNSSMEKREQAITALGLIRKDSHAEELAVKALSDGKVDVRNAAANALGAMDARESIPDLKKALKDPEISVVLSAAHALLMMKVPAAYEVYYAVLTGQRKSGQGLLADQRKMLSDPRKLATFGFETGVGFLPFGGIGMTAVKALTKDDTSPVRAAAAKILADDPDPKSGEALLTATEDKSWLVRAAALDAIARRGDRSFASKIEARMDDEKPVVQYVAAAAVLRLNEAPARHLRKKP